MDSALHARWHLITSVRFDCWPCHLSDNVSDPFCYYASNNPIANIDPDGLSAHGGVTANCMGNMQCESGNDQGGDGDSNAPQKQSCENDGSCPIREDYERNVTSYSNKLVSTAQQIAAGLSTAMEEGYSWVALDGLGKLGSTEKEIEGLGVGYRSFGIFKRRLGPAGSEMDWHHIVEQTTGNVARFGSHAINSEGNLIRLDRATHGMISAFYSTKPKWAANGTMTVREWLSTKSFSEQMTFGKMVLWRHGVDVPE